MQMQGLKTGNAIRALGRMASLQKLLQGGSSSTSSLSSTPVNTPTPSSAGSGSALMAVFEPATPIRNSSQTLSSPTKVENEPGEDADHQQKVTEADSMVGSLGAKGEGAVPSRLRDKSPFVFMRDTESSERAPASRRKLFDREAAVSTQPRERTDDNAVITTAATKGSPEHQAEDHLQQGHKPNGHSPSHVSHLNNRGENKTGPTLVASMDPLHVAEAGRQAVCTGSPVFTREMVDCTAFPGDVVRFDVTVTGDPTPKLVWTLEDEAIEEDTRHILELGANGECSLIVRNVTEDDEGEYSCRAVNRQGEAICSADLIIYGTGAI